AGRGCGTGVTWPVGSRPPGPWGLYDMAGNVWEWVADHHSRCYRGCRRECGAACEGANPRGLCGDPHAPCPEALGQRTVRGGSWWHGVEHASASHRRGVPGANPNPHRFGFRCARDVEPAMAAPQSLGMLAAMRSRSLGLLAVLIACASSTALADPPSDVPSIPADRSHPLPAPLRRI